MFAVFAMLCFLCLSTTMADLHKSCHTPNMTGYFSGINFTSGSVVSAEFSYDSLAKRLHVKNIPTDGVTHGLHFESNKTLDVLLLFDEGFFYEINRKDQSCEKKVLHSAASSMDVPPDAAFLMKITVGSGSVPGEGLAMNMWQGSIPETNAIYTIGLTMGCIPVSVLYYNPTPTASVTHVEIETGIKDPEKLEVPSFCEGKAVEEMPDGTVHTFFTIIF